MAAQGGKKRSGIRGFWVFMILLMAFVVYADRTQTKYKKLDYSRPVYTTSFSILCPQGVLLDMRVDHGMEAAMRMYLSIGGRSEKAAALGCEELRGGIPLYGVHRMQDPFDEFVSVGLSPGGLGMLFTMEGGNLTNNPSGEPDVDGEDIASDSGQHSGETDSHSGANQTVSESNAEMRQRSYDEDKANFERELPLLPIAANLRVFPLAMKDKSDGGEFELVVSPVGPCASIVGRPSLG